MIHEGLAGGPNALFCVFDGHGVEGEKCSRHVASNLPSLLVHSAHFKVSSLCFGLLSFTAWNGAHPLLFKSHYSAKSTSIFLEKQAEICCQLLSWHAQCPNIMSSDYIWAATTAAQPGTLAYLEAVLWHVQARKYPEAFQEQFLACNQGLLKQRSINCSLSGSTGVVAFLQVTAHPLQMFVNCSISLLPSDLMCDDYPVLSTRSDHRCLHLPLCMLH